MFEMLNAQFSLGYVHMGIRRSVGQFGHFLSLDPSSLAETLCFLALSIEILSLNYNRKLHAKVLSLAPK